jgi:hypothetical protein
VEGGADEACYRTANLETGLADRAAGTEATGVTPNATATTGGPAVLTQGNTVEQEAQEYAGRFGWLVLPVTGKRPHSTLAPHGLRSATADPDIIRSWFRREPDAGVAIADRQSGLIAIDRDDRHGGDDQLHELERELGRLPATPRVITPGGIHVYHENPRIRTRNRLADGVDIRDRAYTVAPPSRHESGRRYEWEIPPDEVPVAPLPVSWIERLAHRASEQTHRQQGLPIPRGSRNETLTRIAGAYRRAGSSTSAIEAALIITNAERCQPPLPDSDIRHIARSIGKRSTAPLWALDPLAFANITNLSAIERLVLVALCHRANDQGDVIGGEWLKRETGLSRNSISRATRSLNTQHRILVQQRPNQANRYTLVEPDDLPLGEEGDPSHTNTGSSCTSQVQPTTRAAA